MERKGIEERREKGEGLRGTLEGWRGSRWLERIERRLERPTGRRMERIGEGSREVSGEGRRRYDGQDRKKVKEDHREKDGEDRKKDMGRRYGEAAIEDREKD